MASTEEQGEEPLMEGEQGEDAGETWRMFGDDSIGSPGFGKIS